MTSFDLVRNAAISRKGGEAELASILGPPSGKTEIRSLSSDRCLALMTRGIFQSGFVWKVIEKKWPDFETVFHGFNIKKILSLTANDWNAIATDTRIVRNVPKIKTIAENAFFIESIEESENTPFAHFIDDWPSADLIGLWAFLKSRGSRLGGMTGQYFLRRLGKDAFILSRDVVASLKSQGLDIADNPSSKKDLNAIQSHFNHLHQETGESYSTLSQIMAYSTGENYDVSTIHDERNRFQTGSSN